MTDKELGTFLTDRLNRSEKKFIIELRDEAFGEGVIYYTRFPDGNFGTTPKKDDAFVCVESESDRYLETAQNMVDAMELTFCGSTKNARKAVKVEL